MIFYLPLTAGCAVITSYGAKPAQDISDKDIYSFTVYYNQFAGSEAIRQYVVEHIEDFMAEQAYLSYKILERYSPSAVVLKVVYKVKFWRGKEPLTTHIKTEELMTTAALRGYVQGTKKLIAQGADVNAEDKSGWTPLTIAASKGQAGVIEVLLANGADVNRAKSKDGLTALMAAAAFGHTDSVTALIAGGANVNATNHAGITALQFAAQGGHTQVIELLRKAGAK